MFSRAERRIVDPTVKYRMEDTEFMGQDVVSAFKKASRARQRGLKKHKSKASRASKASMAGSNGGGSGGGTASGSGSGSGGMAWNTFGGGGLERSKSAFGTLGYVPASTARMRATPGPGIAPYRSSGDIAVRTRDAVLQGSDSEEEAELDAALAATSRSEGDAKGGKGGSAAAGQKRRRKRRKQRVPVGVGKFDKSRRWEPQMDTMLGPGYYVQHASTLVGKDGREVAQKPVGRLKSLWGSEKRKDILEHLTASGQVPKGNPGPGECMPETIEKLVTAKDGKKKPRKSNDSLYDTNPNELRKMRELQRRATDADMPPHIRKIMKESARMLADPGPGAHDPKVPHAKRVGDVGGRLHGGGGGSGTPAQEVSLSRPQASVDVLPGARTRSRKGKAAEGGTPPKPKRIGRTTFGTAKRRDVAEAMAFEGKMPKPSDVPGPGSYNLTDQLVARATNSFNYAGNSGLGVRPVLEEDGAPQKDAPEIKTAGLLARTQSKMQMVRAASVFKGLPDWAKKGGGATPTSSRPSTPSKGPRARHGNALMRSDGSMYFKGSQANSAKMDTQELHQWLFFGNAPSAPSDDPALSVSLTLGGSTMTSPDALGRPKSAFSHKSNERKLAVDEDLLKRARAATQPPTSRERGREAESSQPRKLHEQARVRVHDDDLPASHSGAQAASASAADAGHPTVSPVTIPSNQAGQLAQPAVKVLEDDDTGKDSEVSPAPGAATPKPSVSIGMPAGGVRHPNVAKITAQPSIASSIGSYDMYDSDFGSPTPDSPGDFAAEDILLGRAPQETAAGVHNESTVSDTYSMSEFNV